MKNELTYNEAFIKLVALVAQLEDGDIKLDQLSAKVLEANELILICENKLRKIDLEIKDATNKLTKQGGNKKTNKTD